MGFWSGLFTARHDGLTDAQRSQFEAEGLRLMVGPRQVTTTFRKYRAPGKRFSWKKVGSNGSVVITDQRLRVWGWDVLEVGRDDPRLQQLEITLEAPDTICFGYEASVFDPRKAGRVEVRMRTDQARQIVELLTPA